MGSNTKPPTSYGNVVDTWAESARILTEDTACAAGDPGVPDQVDVGDFGFSIPQKASIVGIEIRMKGCYALPGDIPV